MAAELISLGAERWELGDLTIDLGRYEVFRGGRPVHVTKSEFHLLGRLVSARGNVVTIADLLNALWNWTPEVGTRAVEMHVSRLRAKLGKAAIRTVRGIGYALGCSGVRRERPLPPELQAAAAAARRFLEAIDAA